ANHAFEQKRPVALLNLAEGTHGSKRVANELAVDRNDAGLTRQLNKLFERGKITHAWLRENQYTGGLHLRASREQGESCACPCSRLTLPLARATGKRLTRIEMVREVVDFRPFEVKVAPHALEK